MTAVALTLKSNLCLIVICFCLVVACVSVCVCVYAIAYRHPIVERWFRRSVRIVMCMRGRRDRPSRDDGTFSTDHEFEYLRERSAS